MSSIRDVAAGKVAQVDRSSIENADGSYAAIGRFLIDAGKPLGWEVFDFVEVHTAWRSTTMDWYVRTPAGAFAVFLDSVNGSESESHDFGLLYSRAVDAAIRVPGVMMEDLPETVGDALCDLLGPRFGYVSPPQARTKNTAFPELSTAGEYIDVGWQGSHGRNDQFITCRDRESATYLERLIRWLDPAKAGTVLSAQEILWRMVKGKALANAKFIRQYHGDRLVAVQARSDGLAVWLESAFLDEAVRADPELEHLTSLRYVLVIEDDMLLKDRDAVAMRISKPIARKLGGLPRQSTSPSSFTPDPAEYEPRPHSEDERRDGHSAPQGRGDTSPTLSSINAVSISGRLYQDIVFVESDATNGRAEYVLELNHAYGNERELIPCTSFGVQSLALLRRASVGDYLIVNGEVRNYRNQIHVRAKTIVAIVPIS